MQETNGSMNLIKMVGLSSYSLLCLLCVKINLWHAHQMGPLTTEIFTLKLNSKEIGLQSLCKDLGWPEHEGRSMEKESGRIVSSTRQSFMVPMRLPRKFANGFQEICQLYFLITNFSIYVHLSNVHNPTNIFQNLYSYWKIYPLNLSRFVYIIYT